jgi:hypothetical protein
MAAGQKHGSVRSIIKRRLSLPFQSGKTKYVRPVNHTDHLPVAALASRLRHPESFKTKLLRHKPLPNQVTPTFVRHWRNHKKRLPLHATERSHLLRIAYCVASGLKNVRKIDMNCRRTD